VFMRLMETCLRRLGVWMKLNAFATAQENSGARWLGGYSKTCSAFVGGYCIVSGFIQFTYSCPEERE
jgi:hypothetical protein